MPLLLFQTTNVTNQSVDLLFRELLAKAWHLAFTIHDCVEQSLVARIVLPGPIGQIPSMLKLRFERFCPAIFTVTGSAVFCVQLIGAPSAAAIAFPGPREACQQDGKSDKQTKESH